MYPRFKIQKFILIAFLMPVVSLKHANAQRQERNPESTPEVKMNCRNVVRLDQNGGSMEHVPVRDQDGLGICYAETGAGMFDAYLKSHAPLSRQKTLKDRHTSALEAAAYTRLHGEEYGVPRFGKSSEKTLLDGGDACEVVKVLSARGSCNRDTVEDKLGLNDSGDPYEMLALTKKIHQDFEGARSVYGGFNEYEKYNLGSRVKEDVCTNFAGLSFGTAPKPEELSSSLSSRYPFALMSSIMGAGCGKDRQLLPDPVSCVEHNVWTGGPGFASSMENL
ncbi:MAG: hypothetical protein EBX52_03935, partial [Proteobacteria bacterium]|nr:hypothetical protein [Pseudomonadota bacterium]